MRTRRWAAILLLAWLALSPTTGKADEAQYVYDALGRLARVVDSQGNVATYTYDAVGNLLRIERTTVDQLQPQVTGLNPNFGRARSTTQVTISGTNLLFAAVTTDNPGIVVSQTRATNVEVRTTFVIAESARQGGTVVTVDTGLGTAMASFTVRPPFPQVVVSPSIVTVEPNGQTASLAVELSSADPFPLGVTLRTENPAIATVSPSQITIPAGQTAATVTLTSGTAGTTTIIAEGGAAPTGISVYVAAPFTGPAFVASSQVSVDLPSRLVPSTFTPLLAPLVGVDLPPLLVPTTLTPLLAPLVGVDLPPLLVPTTSTPLLAPLVGVDLPPPLVPTTLTPLLAPLVSVKLEAPPP